MTDVVGALPDRLATMIAQMLEKRPDQRFPSWDAVAAELGAIEAGLPPPGGNQSADPLVRVAAQQIEQVRSRELEQRRLAEDRAHRADEREKLLDYWADEFVGELEARVNRLNESLGPGAVRLNRERVFGSSESGHVCGVSFLDARLEIVLNSVPIEAPADFILWGAVQVTTNLGVWVKNLLLLPDPQPYGTWYEVDLGISSFIQVGHRPRDDAGGRYQVTGRIVRATNWEALHYQREDRNMNPDVTYEERLLALDSTLETALHILVKDGGAERPR